MQIDITKFINSTQRDITSREHQGKSARVLTVSHTYATDIYDMWDALTSADRLPRWFAPVTGDLRPGGRFAVEGNASGEVLTCTSPSSLQVTWEYGGDVSWVNVTLAEVDGQTRLTLEHIAHVPEEMWNSFGPGAVGVGWDLGLFGLYLHAVEKSDKPADETAWTTHGEGKDFVILSSSGWGEASVRAGTSREEASAAADRTTAFYTGTSDQAGC
jgi:uncharacterized protein YndB with AHSA1/START domain